LDELVRSRLMSTMGAQNDPAHSQPTTPILSTSGTPRGGRKRVGEAPTPGTITASVRDALASERSAAAGYASSAQGTPRQRNGHGSRQNTAATSNSVSASGAAPAGKGPSNGTPVTGGGTAAAVATAAGRRASPPIRLGPVESRYSFPSYASLGHRNVTSAMRRGDRGVGPLDHIRGLEVPTGDNVIVIHPGSRWLRIGRASDPVPKEIPHVIARRLRMRAQAVPDAASSRMDVDSDGEGAEKTNASASAAGNGKRDIREASSDAQGNDMDVSEERPASSEDDGEKDSEDDGEKDSEDDGDDKGSGEGGEKDEVDQTLAMLRDVLKQHQRQSKRKVPPN
ncbi:actin-like protein arp8, partial [Coemansia sp. RSA 2599]